MNAEQKQRAKDALTNCQASDMAALLQEMIATHEPKPVARVTGYYAGYLSIATVDGRALPAGTALYAAPPHQSEHHLEMVNTPAPSVPDEQLQAAFDRGFKAGNEQGIAQQIEIHKLHDLLAAPTQAEAPADVVRDAARYRWLLDSNWYVGPDSFYCTGGGELEDYQNKNNSAESLDAAVDAAIAAKKGGAK